MGKRSSAKKPQGPKKRDTTPRTFDCLFCNHTDSIDIKMEKKVGCGRLYCRVCGQKFQCGIHYLSQPIDVYCEWVDAAETVAQQAREEGTGAAKKKDDWVGDKDYAIPEEQGEDVWGEP
ncbi:transcription elongation factor Elf1 like-domain-containing protein [Chaetomium strumarium]|uniref:Transcription elongation factor 1 homolog n=1 Tax=Chaetomium strumarium TaxID=1170767 RepID=A0AAJ0GZK6_9PEZI|nr:transcription elongation factor Elf1 like-domain-containing protein [Chaetomium strumarium]